MRRFVALLALLSLCTDALVLRGALLCERGRISAAVASASDAVEMPMMHGHAMAGGMSHEMPTPSKQAPTGPHGMQDCAFMVACAPAVRPVQTLGSAGVVVPHLAPVNNPTVGRTSPVEAPEPPPPRAWS